MHIQSPGEEIARERLPLRIFRILALGGLVLLLIPLVGIIAYTFSADLLPQATDTLGDIEKEISAAGFDNMALGVKASVGAGLVFLALVIVILFLLTTWWLRLHSWGWILSGYIFAIAFGTYLVRDDPLRFYLAPQELAPRFEGAEGSHEVLMRYSIARGTPSLEAQTFEKDPRIGTLFLDTSDPLKLTSSIILQRAEFEQAWLDWEPQRRWLEELNSFERIADLTLESGRRDFLGTISYKTWRSLTYCILARAIIQAVDGQGDQAIDTLLPLLEVAQKLTPHSRSLVRSMVAVVVERSAIATARFILEHANISEAAQSRLAAVLDRSMNDRLRAHQLIAVEFHVFYALSQDSRFFSDFDDLIQNRAVALLAYRPNYTLNEYGDYTLKAQLLASHRRLDDYDRMTLEFVTRKGSPHFRNILGDYITANAVPAYMKILAAYWRLADQRAELKALLAKRKLST